MPKFAAASIVSKRHIASARVTASSFLEHNPAIPFFVLLSDETQAQFDPRLESFHTIEIAQIPIESPLAFRFQYDEMELSYAATPSFLLHLLDQGFDGVLFLKQETLVTDSLAPLFEKLEHHSVILTPHFLQPPSGPNWLECELNVLRAGVFNGGVLAFDNSAEARQILTWWQRKVQRDCFRAVEDGIHFEQRWLDFIPSLAPRAHILRDPGVNIGHWNILDRQIAHANGRYTATGAPCRVVRFSGYQPEKNHMVTRYNARLSVANTGAADGLFHQYQERLLAAGYAQAQQWPYAYGAYDNGVPIPAAARRAYHGLDRQALRFGNPFAAEGPDSFFQWFARKPQ